MITAMKILGGAIVMIVGIWGVLYVTAKPITREEAQRLATEEVYRSAQQLRFDSSVFRGPELLDTQQWGYAFQWRFSDPGGIVEMLVWVDKYGGTEISWDGDLERLRQR